MPNAKIIPADEWDRMAAIAEFFGGVMAGRMWEDYGTGQSGLSPTHGGVAPCCVIGMADAAGVPGVTKADGEPAFRGTPARVLDDAITRVAIFDLDVNPQGRVPFEPVMQRAGFVRGES